ncbi:MAG: glycine zipper 2TM domain-containing protein [Burkholderiaceae bacterium]
MENNTSSKRIHPLVATAAVAVTLVSLTGVAAITGLLPSSHGTDKPVAMNEEQAAAKPDAEMTEPARAEAPAAKPAHKTAAAPARHAEPRVASAPAAAPDYSQSAPRTARADYCDNCGRIESIQAVQHAAQPSGLGIAAGAIVGGLLGNHVGGGNGRAIATVAGAVGGGYAGNEVEKRTRSTTTYEVRVRMEDGSMRTVPQSSMNGWQVGDHVKVVNGSLVSEG